MIAQVLWQSPDLGPAAMGLVALLAAAVLWLYPPQTRGVPRRWRWAMPTLRGLAVAALAAAVAQPIVLRPRSASRAGAVVVLVDRSHSMSVVDRERTSAELVSLAAGLGMLPGNMRSEASGGVRGHLEHLRALADQLSRARSEAEYARVAGRGLAAAAARVRDATERLRASLAGLPEEKSPSELAQRIADLRQVPPALDDAALRTLRTALDNAARAMAAAQTQQDEKLFADNAVVRSICTALREQSRAQLLESGLSQPGGLLASLPAGTPIQMFSFADSLKPMELTPGQPLELDVGGTRTDIGGALRSVLSRMAGKPVQGIVLLSDGRQVGGDVEALASDVSSAGVPVFAVQTAAPTVGGVRQDVSIVNVFAPRGARIGQTIAVRAELRAPALRGSFLDVRLDAESIRLAKRVAIDEDGNGIAEFQLQLSRAGPASLVVSVPPSAGESSDENNRFERSIRVGADAARVLVIAGDDAGKQFAFLNAALSRAPWLELEAVAQSDVAGLTPRTIAAQDVVILCDMPPAELLPAQWSAIEQLMRERGGSVIVCAGKHAPAEYSAHEQAAGLLPFDPVNKPAWRSWPGDEPQFRIVPAAGIELESADLESWRQLAGVSHYIPLTPPTPREGDEVRPILVERDSGAAVLTESRYGLGRVYVVGTDQSWRSRTTGIGGEEKDQFWTQLVRLAAGDPYAAVEGNAALDADDVTPEPDEPFNVRARMLDSSGQPVQVPNLPLRILRGETADSTPAREVTLGSVRGGSGRYEATVSGLPVGRYTLLVDPPEDPSLESRAEPVTLGITVAPHLETEMADLSGDERMLRRIADASGGQFLPFDQFSALPRRLAENREKLNPLVEYTLWDSPYLYGFVLACLSAEWALRKKFGLA